jgi:exopolyphosphatase/guanosine-5'-triphosphate,3'-diphosphate pyrophosphatase
LIKRITILAGCIACLLFAVIGQAQDATVVRRAAFDVGSAAIKCTVADVDIATGRVVEIIETLSEKIDFAEDLDRSYDSNLSAAIMDKGIDALIRIKRQADELKAMEYSAAGGSVFRQARNGRAYFVRIEDETGIQSRVISEQQAAMLSFHAAQQALGTASRELLVWDIGGGSMQMTARRTDGGLLFYLDSMASVTFKNAVIEIIQKKNPDTTTTPNPVSPQEVNQALAYIKAHAMVAVPTVLKAKIRSGNMLVAGIGGVHYYSIPEVMGDRKPSFTREEVEATLKKWTGRPDEDFDSEYAATRFTNLILVLGYMDALGITEVHPLKINQAHGLLTTREFW